MSTNDAPNDSANVNQEAQKIWDANAAWWDNQVGEGNSTQRLLIGPTTERLLALQPDELVLDVGCGNGLFSRRMAELGARVVACDFSEKFLELARARTTKNADRIQYLHIDATNEAQLLSLGERRFDAAVCNMALFDMAEIAPLLSALTKLLKPGGRFVFSVVHPVFNNPSGSSKVIEEEDRDGDLVTTYAVKVSRYLQPAVAKGIGIVGQPQPHYYFHRPLSDLLTACFDAGFVMDGIVEPTTNEDRQPARPFSWTNFMAEIPAFLVARMRLLPI